MCVYLGQPLVPRWQSLPPRCAARREKSARWESCTTPPRLIPQPLQHHLFGRSWHQFGSARAGNSGHRSSIVERSVASSGGVVGGFRRFLRKTRFFVRIFCLWSEFESAARTRGLGLGYASDCSSLTSAARATSKPGPLLGRSHLVCPSCLKAQTLSNGTTTLPGLPRARGSGAGALGPRQRRRR